MDDAVALRTAEQPRLTGRGLRILRDEKLAAMVAGGSDDAFAELYRRHHQAVHRYCVSLVRQEADARDALQSSMLAALSSLRARPIDGSFKPWLFRIAHNQSISIIRARSREAPTDAPPPVPFVDDRETREQVRTLVSDLAALPERQRGAIVMREMSGLSYAEIAAALGTSEAGGKQLVYEARSALHELRDGHEMGCDLVRERISARDRRLLRGRKVRAHLRGCQPCQDFDQAVRRRRPAFAALAPPLAPLAAAAVLQDVFGGAGAGSGAGGAGVVAGGAGIASGGAPLAGSAALKLAAAAVLAGTAGVGAYAAGDAILADSPASTPAATTESTGAREHQGRTDARDGSSPAAREGAGPRAEGRADHGAAPHSRAGSTDSDKAAGSEGSDASDPASPGAAGNPGAPSGPGPSNGGSDGSGESGGGTPEPPPPGPGSPPNPPPPPSGGGSGVPPGTPPGHGGTPPGQGGTPPGQAGGDVPPGHLGKPPKGG